MLFPARAQGGMKILDNSHWPSRVKCEVTAKIVIFTDSFIKSPAIKPSTFFPSLLMVPSYNNDQDR